MAGDTFRLTVTQGPTPGKSIALTKDVVTVGRDASNDVAINDAEVSRHHARLTRQPGGYLLEDVGSTNGTFVNGQRLTGPYALKPGDALGLGENLLLTFEAEMVDAQATVIGMGPATVSPPSWAATPEAPPEAPPPPELEPYPAETAAPERPRSGWRWALAGCGCLLIVLCVAIVGGLGWYIDSNNLYCPWLGLCS